MSKRRKKEKPATEAPSVGVYTGIYDWAGLSQTISSSPPPLTVEQRLERLEKQVIGQDHWWNPPTLSLLEKMDRLYKYFNVCIVTSPTVPAVTTLKRKRWWQRGTDRVGVL